MAEFATKEKVKENRIGIPAQLKERMEQHTRLSFDDVRLHYNSDKPAKLGAFAYTQGNQVEIGPGQERHLPHELGAGGRISMPASGNNGAGIVQRYRIIKDCTFAQAPDNERYSKVMVRNGEPASIYFEQTVIPTVQAETTLSKLGITKTGESIKFDDLEKDENLQSELHSTRTFFRFGQGRIPNVSKVHPFGYEEIQPAQDQPYRPEKKKNEAISRIKKQDDITCDLLNNAQMLRSYMLSQEVNQISAQLNKLTDKYIEICEKQMVSEEYIAITSLGYDIILSMYTLRSITNKLMSKPPVVIGAIYTEYGMLNAEIGNVPEEVVQRYKALPTSDEIAPECILPFALLLAKEFLSHVNFSRENGGMQVFLQKIDDFSNSFLDKYKQLVEKKAIPKIIYLIEDICKFVMEQRDNMLALEIAIEQLEYRHKQVNEEKKLIQFIPILPTECDLSAKYRQYYSSSKIGVANFNRKDMSAVHWPYHYVTPISLPSSIIGPHDRLFIEDAVGKSSHGKELANAHWAAHIYGQREDKPMSQQGNTQQNEWKELDCRFNQLSVGLRSIFFEKNKMGEGSGLTISYVEEGNLGLLQIVVEKNILKYQFSPGAAPYVQHFEMDLAKTLADEFVQQAVNIEKMEQLERIRDNSKAYELATSGRIYPIENINPQKLAEGLKEAQRYAQASRKKK